MLKRFPEKLKLLRERHNLSQGQLARQLSVVSSHISQLESGKRRPGAEICIKVADFFGIALDTLVRDELDLDAEGER